MTEIKITHSCNKEYYETFANMASQTEINLAAPLDKPMGTMKQSDGDFVAKINELIERQNALMEIVKRLVLK
jgi:hypothetical protein